MGNLIKYIKIENMKLLALTALLAIATAQDEEAAGDKIASGESCAENKGGCDEGLCCGEGVYEEDVVDGEVSDNYEENMIIICYEEGGEEYTNDDGEKYYFSCMKDTMATMFAATFAAIATSAFLMA